MDDLKYMLEIDMTKFADELGDRMREWEKEKVIPGICLHIQWHGVKE